MVQLDLVLVHRRLVDHFTAGPRREGIEKYDINVVVQRMNRPVGENNTESAAVGRSKVIHIAVRSEEVIVLLLHVAVSPGPARNR